MWRVSDRMGYRPFRFFDPEDPPGNPPAPDPKANDPPKFDAITSQDDFDRRIAARIKRAEEKAREEAETATREKIKTEAESERHKEQGEFKKLFEAEQAKVTKLQEEMEALKSEAEKRGLDSVRSAMAKKYGIPEKMASRLLGDDEAAIEADAKAVAKDLGVDPPNTEGGSTKKPGKQAKGAESTGTYTFGSATRRVPFPDRVKPKEE